MSGPSETRIALLRIIVNAPEPIKSDSIRAHESLRHTDGQVISQALWAIKNADQAVVDAAKAYSITAKGRAVLAEAGDGVAAERSSPKPTSKARVSDIFPPPATRRKKPDLSTDGIVQTTLNDLVTQTQRALDTYLLSVADPAVYEPLKRARDEAAVALASFQASEQVSKK